MNVFKIFATMSLVDAISKPLAYIQKSLKSTEGAAGSLSNRLGRLATGFGKVAAASAIFLGSLGALTSQAIAFESKMADVAKVVDFESPAELEGMSRAIQDLSLQIPIAAEGFADIVAAAAQSGVAKDDLIDFSIQAAKMGVAFDVAAGEASKTMADWRAGMGLTLQETYSLADAVNHLANNMNATAPEISQVLNRAGAVGKAAGFTETQLAALAATGLSAGASADIVGTGLNSIFATLSQGSSMTKEAAKAFQTLGLDAAKLGQSMQVDAQGTILNVLESIAALPKENQLSVITSAFGQLSLKSIAPMVGNLDNLRGAFNLVGDAANYAGSMEAEYAARSATTENSLQLMKNSFNVLAIAIGTQFLPVIDAAAKGISGFIRILISAARTEVGGFLIKLAAGIAAAVVGVTGLITAFALLKPIILIVGSALGAVAWPITLIAGAVALLTLAWKKDFLGLATMARNFAGKVKLVFQGVYEIFSTLKDGKGELSAELAKKIEAAGLMGLVTDVSRAIYRVMNFFKGLASTFQTMVQPAFSRLGEAFRLLITAIQPLFGHLSRLSGGLTSAAGKTDTAPWLAWGQVIGDLAGTAVAFLVDSIGVAVTVISTLTDVFSVVNKVCSKFGTILGDLVFTVVNFHQTVFSTFASIGDLISESLSGAIDSIASFSLIDAGLGLMNGFAAGIQAGAGTLINTVSGILGQVRAFLPSSDAQVGPLNNLTASGMAFISTFAAGIKARATELISAVSGILGQVRGFLTSSDAKYGPLSDLTASGRAFPSTYAKGIHDGAPVLIATTERMLDGLNLAPPYFEMPDMNYGDVIAPQVMAPQFDWPNLEFGAGQPLKVATPQIDLPQFDLPELKFGAGQPLKVAPPQFDLPNFDMPNLGSGADLPMKPTISQVDLSRFELPKFDLPKLDFGPGISLKVTPPNFDLPQFDLPSLNFGAGFPLEVTPPKFELPQFDLPNLDLGTDFPLKLTPPKFNLPQFELPKLDFNSALPQLSSALPSFAPTLPGYGVDRLPGGALPEPSFQIQDGGQSSSPLRPKTERDQGGRTIHFHIGKIELPSVEDADGFIAALQDIVDQRI